MTPIAYLRMLTPVGKSLRNDRSEGELMDQMHEAPADACERFNTLIQNNPAYKGLCFSLLRFCLKEHDRIEAMHYLDHLERPKTITQNSQQIITMLVDCGVVSQQIYVEGEAFSGDEHDLYAVTDLPENALIEYRLLASDTGKKALEELNPQKRIVELFESKPRHERAFIMVLKACLSKEKKQSDIEQLLMDNADVLTFDEKTGLPRVYPAYFTAALEEAGALVWKGAWRTTQEGKAFLEARA